MQFGWLNEKKTYKSDQVEISFLGNKDAIAEIIKAPNQDGDWYYPPIIFKSGESGPQIPIGRVVLPDTHEIQQNCGVLDSKFLEFTIIYFGWLKGLQLVPSGWGHLGKVAIKSGRLNDFYAKDGDFPFLINKCHEYWHLHKDDGLNNAMQGALHWYLFSYSYDHYFERFFAQYMVLDALYKIKFGLGKRKSNHNERIEFISKELNLECPSWGQPKSKDGSTQTEISIIRNELIHECKIGGQLLGFGLGDINTSILMELQAFNSRFILSIFGVVGEYTRSSCQTCQMHGLDFD